MQHEVLPEKIHSLLAELENHYGKLGFEFQPFKIGWYNSFVQPIFRLNYDENTVAFLIISAPRMFEEAFVSFLEQRNGDISELQDPIDQCMIFYLSKIPQLFSNYGAKIVYDFELHPNRRPKIVMQSVAHASGAAYFYHPQIIGKLESSKKLFGVCIHPKYGGWFALRAVVILESVRCPSLIRNPPSDVVPSKEERLKLLELYNNNWADWKYRDIIKPTEKYSELQMKYFSTVPGNRGKVIQEILGRRIFNGSPPDR